MLMSSTLPKMVIQNVTVLCMHAHRIGPRGFWPGNNPLNYPTPVLLCQLALSAFVIGTFQFLLLPLGQTSFVAQIMGGMALGPTFMGRNKIFTTKIFSPESLYVAETFAFFGCMLFLFLVGVKMDLSMIKKSRKKAVAIGISSFLVPLIVNLAVSEILIRTIPMDKHLRQSLPYIAGLLSMRSFHVIACLLTDLKLLNSELGRVALSAAMVSGLCSWCLSVLVFSIKQSLLGNHSTVMWMVSCICFMLIVIVYVMRPIMLRMVRWTAEGKAIKEGYIFVVFMMMLGCSFFGELVGQHFLIGPVILGLVVPGGPPLGAALVDKLETFVTCILLPIYFVVSAARVNLSCIHLRNFGIVLSMGLFSFMGKLTGVMLPSLYCKMPFLDSFSLGLIMSAQGIIELQLLRRAMKLKLIHEEEYTIMIVTMVLMTGTATPLAKIIYNPSRRYKTHKKRSILHTRPDVELRLLACVHQHDHVPSIINLIEVSNPTKESPICVYALHLVELLGRASPVLVAHQRVKKKFASSSSSHPNRSERIINAFRLYEQQNQGIVIVNPFTAISPYTAMHEDVCMLALDKKTAMVIVPFHKQWTIEDSSESSNAIRNVNRNILNKAPCSVGIFVDRGTLKCSGPLYSRKSAHKLGMIFLGGSDDREALAYAMRMADHPWVNLTVIRFLGVGNGKIGDDKVERKLDVDLINEFRLTDVDNERFVYREEVVTDSVGTISVIRSVENSYDLILVGRRHMMESPLLMGMTAWNEFPELGFVGDMLASSDSECKASVLVVQQEVASIEGSRAVESPKFKLMDAFATVDMPREAGRVWPLPQNTTLARERL